MRVAGVVVKTTARSIADQAGQATSESEHGGEEDAEEEPEESDGTMTALDEVATFDEVVVWGHDALPEENDPVARGLEEWIGLAATMNAPGVAVDDGQT